MAKKEVPEGYKEVKVPRGHNVWTSDENGVGRMAKAGEIVHLHRETLDRDPVLARAVVDNSEMPEPDYYDSASDESLKAALDTRDLAYDEKATHDDLAMAARNAGVSQQELNVQMNPPVSGTGKAATQAPGKK